MTARIYRPTKTAMQSGRAKTHDWVLEFAPDSAQTADPLMGWIGQGSTSRQVRLRFATEDEAIAYCKKRGLDYDLEEPQEPRLRPKSYADNFRYDRVR
jgi:hypothetical protein